MDVLTAFVGFPTRMRSLLFILALFGSAAQAAEEFPLTADSQPQPGIPKGTLVKETYRAAATSVFPGTEREYQIYLPQQLDKTRPAAFMVFQDGVIYQAPVVFDNLIASKAIPPLIGIFIKPGVVPAASPDALPRYNRSYEYDRITPDYSRFLINEFLPHLEQKHGLKLSTNPEEAAISGNSSGGICAFMVAWHRPDRFRRVFTGVGTYVGIHGADRLSVLVRKTEPKPLRVFLQSGTNDNNLYCGDWWVANQLMERSLTWSGYEVDHAWSEGGHNQKHASQIFPEVLRWLWQGWENSKPVLVNSRGDSKWKGYEICLPDKGWQVVPQANAANQKLAALEVGESGQVSRVEKATSRVKRHDGLSPAELKGEGLESLEHARTTWSPDQTLLYLSQPNSNRLRCYQVDGKGQATFPQDYVILETADDDSAQAGGLCVDMEGRIYVATRLGIQVCDQAGRVNFIIPTPTPALDVCFGGSDSTQLFVLCQDGLYQRPVKVAGVVSRKPPVKPAAPKL